MQVLGTEIIFHVAADEKVHVSVPVIIAPGDPCPESSVLVETGLLRNVCEGSVAVVVVEPVAAGRMRKLLRRVSQGTSHIHHIEIREAIIVVVAPSSPGTHVLGQLGCAVTMKVLKMDSRPFRHIFELHAREVFRQITRQAAARNASVGVQHCPRKGSIAKCPESKAERFALQIRLSRGWFSSLLSSSSEHRREGHERLTFKVRYPIRGRDLILR